MARRIKFKTDELARRYEQFLQFLQLRIPQHLMPPNRFYSRFNSEIKRHLIKYGKGGLVCDSILELVDLDKLSSILDAIEARYAYVSSETNLIEGLKCYIHFLKEQTQEEKLHSSPLWVEITEQCQEGSLLDCHGSKYERNKSAREACLRHYGYTCHVCGFNFKQKYGARGEDFIEVHHIIPLSEQGCESHSVDPIKDLVPVCSNCHSMLHRTRPAISIEELQNIIALEGLNATD